MKIEGFAQIFERVINKYNTLEKKPNDFGTGTLLYRSEIHMIDVIGKNNNINITNLATQLGITKGAVSQSIDRLKKKGMVTKNLSPETENEVVLSLTEKGNQAYIEHLRFHQNFYRMLEGYLQDISLPEMQKITQLLQEFEHYLDRKIGIP